MWFQTNKPEYTAKAIAYYRHSAQDRQENSIPIQREQIKKFADKHGIELIDHFSDHGKSGLSTEKRDGFNSLIDKVVNDKDTFQYVIALDMSRWGRFPDLDVSPYYRHICKQYGKEVIYASYGMPKEDDIGYHMRLLFEGVRATEFSQDLSRKVFNGGVMVTQQGYKAGGMAPYGLERLLLDEQRNPVQILKHGQQKSIQNQRVTLTPGDKKDIAVIKRIFNQFVNKRKSTKEISQHLNDDGIVSPKGKLWSSDKVLHILRNEVYIGTMVYNKTGHKLLSKCHSNPPDQWIRGKDAFPAIVDKGIFHKVQEILKQQHEEYERKHSHDNMILHLRKMYEKYGIITDKQISINKEMLSPHSYINKYHSLGLAFQNIFPNVIKKTIVKVSNEIRSKSEKFERYDDFFVVNDTFTLLIQPSVPIPNGYQACWAFRPDPRKEIDITLGVPLSNGGKYSILGFLIFPRMMVDCSSIRFFDSSQGKMDFFGSSNIDVLYELL